MQKILEKKLDIDAPKFKYHEDRVVWIHDRETITKQDYNAQVGMRTEFSFVLGGRPLIIVSLADAIQILTVLQKDKERSKLIRKLIIKIEKKN